MSPGFITLSVGRSGNAINLLVPQAPPVHSSATSKAAAFDYAADLILCYISSYSSAELIAAFHHILSNSYNAGIEATTIRRPIFLAFFLIDNLIELGFRDSAGKLVTASGITTAPSKRSAGLAHFAFRSTVDPSTLDPTLEFLLPLP